QLGVERFDAVADLAHACHLGGGVLTALLGLADGLRGAVAVRLEVLGFAHDVAARGVESDDLLHELGAALAGERALDHLGLLADQPEVQHGATALRRARSSPPRRGRWTRPGR